MHGDVIFPMGQSEHYGRRGPFRWTWSRRWGIRLWVLGHELLSFRRPSFELKLWRSEEDGRCSLFLMGLSVGLGRLPLRVKPDPNEMGQRWGFTILDGALHLSWGRRHAVIWMPWDFVHEKREWMRPGGYWTIDEEAPRFQETYPYHYLLQSGEVQHVLATIEVERRIWRRRAVPAFLPFPRLRRTEIDVRFSEEVGERAGSWKGGCIGCGYTMKPGETPRDTLMRMQKERKF